MSPLLRALGLAVCCVVLTAISARAPMPASADHADGNMPAAVSYWIVADYLRVCDNSSIVSTTVLNGAIGIWNSGTGNFGDPILVSSCTNWGTRLVDVVENTCPDPPGLEAIACTFLPSSDSPQQININMEPDSAGNDNFVKSVVAHELGHNLGFAHTGTCPDSIMTASICSPPVTQLQPVDQTNFHNGYHVDAVTSFAASSPSAHTVRLTWNQNNVHNENSYLVERLEPCFFSWVAVAWIPKNSTIVTVDDQQGGGPWTYQVRGLTGADPIHTGFGDLAGGAVTVASTLPPPASLTSRFPSTTVNRISWPAVPGAHHYHVRTDFSPGGNFCSNTGALTATQFDGGVPAAVYDGVPWYNRVMACTASDLCSPMTTTFALTERSNVNGWNYVFTYNRNGGNIELQYINFMSSLYGEFALALHITNGDTWLSPRVPTTLGQDPTPCIPYNTISGVLSYPGSAFTALKVGTVGHSILDAVQCGPTDTGDGQDNRWGLLPGF